MSQRRITYVTECAALHAPNLAPHVWASLDSLLPHSGETCPNQSTPAKRSSEVRFRLLRSKVLNLFLDRESDCLDQRSAHIRNRANWALAQDIRHFKSNILIECISQ
jgi:hypothetical protein